MEVECLSLKDLLSPKHIKVDLDGTGGEHEHKVNTLYIHKLETEYTDIV